MVLATRRCPMLVISGATHALILAGDPRPRAGAMPHGRLLKSSSWVPHALGGPATRGPPSVYLGSVSAPSGQSRRTVTWKTATVPLGALCRRGTPNSDPHLGAVHAFILAGGPRARASMMPHGRLLPYSLWLPHALESVVLKQQTRCRIQICLHTASGPADRRPLPQYMLRSDHQACPIQNVPAQCAFFKNRDLLPLPPFQAGSPSRLGVFACWLHTKNEIKFFWQASMCKRSDQKCKFI